MFPMASGGNDLNEQTGRIGPNAIIRIAEVLRDASDEAALTEVFQTAGLDHYIDALPDEMVDEAEVTRLHQALRDTLGLAKARPLARRAGTLTGDYLLAKRIPRPAQWILAVLPPPLACRVLLGAIQQNAWTFAGTGTFSTQPGNPAILKIERCPICRGARTSEPICDYFAATYERLFTRLVHRRATVVETECEATGAAACTFEVIY